MLPFWNKLRDILKSAEEGQVYKYDGVENVGELTHIVLQVERREESTRFVSLVEDGRIEEDALYANGELARIR